jgi:HD-like signal output (HDOD) protein/CheY-like chemotaxis protein
VVTTKRAILVVGSESTELPEVCRDLQTSTPHWTWQHARNGLAALDHLTLHPCDAVVADLRLEDLSGLQLLNQVLAQWPHIHRIILADLGDVDALLRCVGGVHQFLARPGEAQRILVVLVRAFTLDLWLPNQKARRLLGSLPSLPSPAADYHATVEDLEHARLDEAVRRLAVDPPMAAKILQLANSAAWGPPLDEASPVNAARELGLSNVRRMMLLSHTYSSFRDSSAAGFDPEAHWREAGGTASLARAVARDEGAPPEMVEQAATAGLLHSLGRLALAVNLPDKFRELAARLSEGRIQEWEAAQAIYGATQGEVGGSLLGLWGLPMPVIEAVALHDHPACFLSSVFSPLTAVHVARALWRSTTPEEARKRIDLDYLATLNLQDHLPAWWRCRDAALRQQADS